MHARAQVDVLDERLGLVAAGHDRLNVAIDAHVVLRDGDERLLRR